ncbi:hypothetical protein D9756_006352 [Leucocoprinus leucothites]|uniref:CCHC-type domain-containing protein n=1 Tax=Leucocoprinus leucothites TaxID=201217 RepID=A0A8H5LH61_9AGAR|nr:hypothetical protein D9756_006352 [Leucoagaricus leucothites]
MSDSSSSNNRSRADPPHLAARLSKQFQSHFHPESEPEQPTSENPSTKSREPQNTLFTQQSPKLPTPQQNHLYSQPSKDNEADTMKKKTKPISMKPLLDSTISIRQNPLHSESNQLKPKKCLHKDLPLLPPIHNQNPKPLTDHKEEDHQWNPTKPTEDPKPWQQTHLDIGQTTQNTTSTNQYNKVSKGKDCLEVQTEEEVEEEVEVEEDSLDNHNNQTHKTITEESNMTYPESSTAPLKITKDGKSNFRSTSWQTVINSHPIMTSSSVHSTTWEKEVPTFSSAEAFWQALDQSFRPFNESKSFLRKWLALKQLQRPIKTYIMEFRILANRARVRETQQLIHQFQESLDPSIAIRAISKHPGNNLEEWFMAARAAEETERMEADYYRRHPQIYSRRKMAKPKRHNHYQSQGYILLQPNRDLNAMDIDAMEALLQNFTISQGYQQNDDSSSDESEDDDEDHQENIKQSILQVFNMILSTCQKESLRKGMCFKCKQTRHFARDCPKHKVCLSKIPRKSQSKNAKHK